jgi:homogentisate solanesyltransferase
MPSTLAVALAACAHALRAPALRRPSLRRIALRADYLDSLQPAVAAVAAPATTKTKPKALDENSISGDTFLGAFYKFTRPHTIRGTMLASGAGVIKAIGDAGGLAKCWSWSLVPQALAGLVALLCGNAFIVGINQLYDVEVDRINKPFLPIAAGELSLRRAKLILAACAVTGPLIVLKLYPPLIVGLYAFGTFMGTAYSVPPFRLKSRGPIFAGLTIACCRGFLLNFGVYYAVLESLKVPFTWSPGVSFMARFMTGFAGVIAVTKDLPDVAGDIATGVPTLATKFGVGRVAKWATGALLVNYVSAIAQGLLSGSFRKVPMVGGHALLAAFLVRNYRRYRKQGAEDEDAVKGYYKSIWDNFYLEYLLYCFI